MKRDTTPYDLMSHTPNSKPSTGHQRQLNGTYSCVYIDRHGSVTEYIASDLQDAREYLDHCWLEDQRYSNQAE